MYQFRELPQPPGQRRYLFLQGPASPFFSKLASELKERGQQVFRINFCFGDQLFWSLPATNYTGRRRDWDAFLARFLETNAITDIILFGDCRSYHRTAVELAGKRDIPVHVCEEGYFRPNWVTVELGGVNGFSSLPRDPDVIRELAEAMPPYKPPVSLPAVSIVRRAYWDILYNVATVFGRPLYPFYRRHRQRHPFVEYAGWLRKLLRLRKDRAHAEAESRRLFTHPGGFYLVPLQLDGDFQIRRHSRFPNNTPFLREVIESFARTAPADARLLVKNHPLDPGLINRKKQVRTIAAEFGVSERVICIDGGQLPQMLDAARGCVLVNSTTGTSALQHGCPTIALGDAIFAVPGLTFQGSLDDFWLNCEKPDVTLLRAFRRLVMQRTQVNGSFFSLEGIALAIDAVAARVGAPAVQPVITFARSAEVDGEFNEGAMPLYIEAERDHIHLARSVGPSSAQHPAS